MLSEAVLVLVLLVTLMKTVNLANYCFYSRVLALPLLHFKIIFSVNYVEYK